MKKCWKLPMAAALFVTLSIMLASCATQKAAIAEPAAPIEATLPQPAAAAAEPAASSAEPVPAVAETVAAPQESAEEPQAAPAEQAAETIAEPAAEPVAVPQEPAGEAPATNALAPTALAASEAPVTTSTTSTTTTTTTTTTTIGESPAAATVPAAEPAAAPENAGVAETAAPATAALPEPSAGNTETAIAEASAEVSAKANAEASAKAAALRAAIAAGDYGRHSASIFAMAESKFAEAEALRQKGDPDSLKASLTAFGESAEYYEFVLAKGLEYQALEAKDKAAAAKTAALDALADLNTPDGMAAADTSMDEALAALGAQDYGRALAGFAEAGAAYDAARESTIAAHADSESAIAAAREALRLSAEVAETAEIGETIYIKEAQDRLVSAQSLHDEARFQDSAVNAREVLNYASMSDAFVAGELLRLEREAAERRAAEIAAADQSIAEAKRRTEWAEAANLASDYPSQAARAASLLRSIGIAYGNEAYAAAKALADEVSSLLSDEFKTAVLADRKAAEAGKARLSELATDRAPAKAIVERAQAEARDRLAWAELNGIREEYPVEYGKAAEAMTASFVAYGSESYGQAADSARLVGAILSDEFKGQVAARREAARAEAARLAAEKAEAERRAAEAARLAAERKAAEAALADAKARMAWASSADLGSDYPDDFTAGSRDFSAAETAFSGERYPPAAASAAEVSARFSDAFMAKVAADRRAKQELAARKAAEKAAAEAAIADARRRMAWANENAIAADYPKEFGAAAAAMEGSIAFFGKEAFPGSERDAKTVSSTLSDAFMAKVAADRKAAALRAADTLAPPALKVTASPSPFSPDTDGVDDTLAFSLEATAAAGIAEWKLEIFETSVVESSKAGAAGQDRLFASWSGKGQPPASIAWDGKSSRKELVESATDYKYRFTATTAKGKTAAASGTVSVDVLVIREGDRLKLKVPSIVFRANYADFVGLQADVVANNERVLARIAEILNKFPGYAIKIQGNANSASKIGKLSAAAIAAEETKELLPLSKARAEYVRDFLVKNGVDPKRLSVEGLGSSEPVVSFQDAQNRWKNRRVEFVLIKQR
jgi:flagellar motor protein MotB